MRAFALSLRQIHCILHSVNGLSRLFIYYSSNNFPNNYSFSSFQPPISPLQHYISRPTNIISHGVVNFFMFFLLIILKMSFPKKSLPGLQILTKLQTLITCCGKIPLVWFLHGSVPPCRNLF